MQRAERVKALKESRQHRTLLEADYLFSEVGVAVTCWNEIAKGVGLSKSERDRISSAFERDDLAHAVKL